MTNSHSAYTFANLDRQERILLFTLFILFTMPVKIPRQTVMSFSCKALPVRSIWEITTSSSAANILDRVLRYNL